MIPLNEQESDRILGRLKQLQSRYSQFIANVARRGLVVDVEFYLEDLSMEATHAVLTAGITAVHRLDAPRVMSLQLPSLLAQNQGQQVVDVLDAFLRQMPDRCRSTPAGEERR